MSLCGASLGGLLASRVNRGCEGSNDCVEAEGFSLSAIEGKGVKGSPSITHPPPSNGRCKNGS